MPHVTLEQARAAKTAALRRFDRLPSLVGVGVTRVNGEYAVKLNLREPLAPAAAVPSEIDGVPLVVEVVGSIRKRASRP
ncbi:MAG: hypothetical protein HOQ29_14425 [Acidobacteria bacterium]|nr:hypothetical protein [Acidobacteriota bacterium]